MCCHKMQLEFICIISGFSKFSAIIRYCCHDESLELSRACFCNAVAISNFTLPFGSSLYFPLVPVFKKKKKTMEKYNHHPNSEKRDLYWDMLKRYRHSSVWELRCFAWRRGMVGAFLIFLGLRMLYFSALRPISSSLSPPIYLAMLRKFFNFLSFKLVHFHDDFIYQRSAKFCLFLLL